MSVFPIYSRSVDVMPDVYVYDQIPDKLRNQIIRIWGDFFRQLRIGQRNSIFQKVTDIISNEHGVLNFPGSFGQIVDYFKELKDSNLALDVIQIMFLTIEESPGYMLAPLADGLPVTRLKYPPQLAIQSLNDRFNQSAIGYQYANGKILRLSNDILHEGTVLQTLSLITLPEYKNVNAQYMTAHEHFKKGEGSRYRDCITWCLMAFESTIKIIAEKNGWGYEESWSASRLIKLLFEQNFFPRYRDNALNSLRGLIEQSLLPIRNKQGPHGEGSKTVVVPVFLARFMLYDTGATIRLMIETQLEREKALWQ
jgi:hypothetical protein